MLFIVFKTSKKLKLLISSTMLDEYRAGLKWLKYSSSRELEFPKLEDFTIAQEKVTTEDFTFTQEKPTAEDFAIAQEKPAAKDFAIAQEDIPQDSNKAAILQDVVMASADDVVKVNVKTGASLTVSSLNVARLLER